MLFSYLIMILALLSLILFFLFSYNYFFLSIVFPIFVSSSIFLSVSILLDWISLCFSSSVLFISSAIIIYSHSYIPSKEHKRFSLILLCFISSMITLIFSNNIFFLMLGWDGLGLSSYILVIYYQNSNSKESGALTILSNRVGDIFIILSISTMTLSGMLEFFLSKEFPWLVLMLLIMASFSKSAQVPFSAWLPAAMAAPTPISALVHSSTLVTAGVFLSIRLMSNPHPSSMMVILMFSFVTLFFSGLAANWEQDLKKIIALSTLSQIAMMFFAVAINSVNTAYFHLIIHAFFKSTMFLCAGILIHNSSYQDLRFQSSSHNTSILLITSFGICNMALMGLPFLSGFFSKDMIMEIMMSSSINLFIFILSTFAIGLTVSYSSRLTLFSFNLSSLQKKEDSFFTEKPMILPILLLTPTSIFMGSSMMWILLPPQNIIMPFLLKMSILTIITTGFIVGWTLSFSGKKFNLLGEPSISIWFLHSISCLPSLNFLKNGKQMSIIDLTWIEVMSAQGSFLLFKSLSHSPSFSIYMRLLMMSFLFILPIIIFS